MALKVWVIDPWCNGNTAGFGPVVQGSNPCGSTKEEIFIKMKISSFSLFEVGDPLLVFADCGYTLFCKIIADVIG